MSKAENCIQFLEEAILKYDKILLFDRDELILNILNVKTLTVIYKRILILSIKQMAAEFENITFREITEDEKEQILKLYFTYEFSDKFLFISRKNSNYGGVFHFVDTGILNMEEAFEALIV